MDAQDSKPVDVPQGAAPPQGGAPQPPSVLAEPDALDAVRLEVRLEEFERRLRARSIELETEIKAKERLRERVRELTHRVDELQETASALHREAVSSTSLARELDATLKVASEARLQLGAALESERSRRAESEERLGSIEAALTARFAEAESNAERLTQERAALQARVAAAEETSARAAAELARERESARALAESAAARGGDVRKREEELEQAHRQVAALRQKTAGHEAHIDSLRADLEQIRVARDEAAAAASAALERARAVENAEQIRREGVEAFEKARERGIRQEAEAERLRAEIAEGMRRVAGESEALKAKSEKLKVELRARAEREIAEMRHALDEERARLYADIEAEREARGRAAPAAPLPGVGAPAALERPASRPPLSDPVQRPSEEGSARRREILREAESFLAPQTPAPATPTARSNVAPAQVVGTRPPEAPVFQWDEEMRLLLWVAIGVGIVSALVGGAVLYQG